MCSARTATDALGPKGSKFACIMEDAFQQPACIHAMPPTVHAALQHLTGAVTCLQGMMGAMTGGQPGEAGGPTFVPTAPGTLTQSSMMSSDASGTTRSTTVGADPNAHTTQTYDPTTKTLITTTVDPATGAALSGGEPP